MTDFKSDSKQLSRTHTFTAEFLYEMIAREYGLIEAARNQFEHEVDLKCEEDPLSARRKVSPDYYSGFADGLIAVLRRIREACKNDESEIQNLTKNMYFKSKIKSKI